MENERKNEDELRELRGLVEQIKTGDCVLVLGPRVAVRPNDPDRRPLDELLARQMLDSIGVSAGEGSAAAPSLRRAAELFARQKAARVLRVTAKDFYAQEVGSTTDFHRDLAALPFRLCISASPDSLMLTAFEKAGKSPQRHHYNFRRDVTPLRSDPLHSATPQKPLVYHLFGLHEDPDSLVLTEGDLIQFLIAVVKGVPPVPDQVRSVLAEELTSFLFVGFGFHHWYLRVLLHVMGVYSHSGGIAFEDPQFFDLPEHEEAVGFFADRSIDFRPLRWEAFAKQLRETYEAEAPPKRAAASAAADAPLAFLSYASEDGTWVDGFAADLEARGIRVWQDRQKLRAGDQWETALNSVIEKQVDYVIVVQTPAMKARVEGVFHAEIEAAQKRQARFGEFEGQQLRFLIPVKVGRCESLSSLSRFHVLNVSDDGAIDLLAVSIKEDWQRRAGRKISAAT